MRWVRYVARRNFLRYVLIGGEVKTQIHAYSLYFDHWRRATLELQCRLLLQRVARGFIARNRKKFIRRLQAKAVLIQSGTRKFFQVKRLNQTKVRINWAVCTIQRMVRGNIARKKLAILVEATYDTMRRRLERRKRVWKLWRIARAFIGMWLYMRRYIRRVREIKKEEQDERVAELNRAMADEAEKARIKEEVYKRTLSQWYVDRKIAHDQDTLNEQQTLADRKAIMERRGRLAAEQRAQKQRERDELAARMQEEKTEAWLMKWEAKIARAGKDRRAKCEAVLLQPETPEELRLKTELQKRIRLQVKDVLRR
jgi:hypothetical protein